MKVPTALYFHKESLRGTSGAIRVANTDNRLNLQTFTFETFFRLPKSFGDWNCIAVMPGKLTSSQGKVINYDSWAIRVTSVSSLHVRFTKPAAMSTDVTNVGSYNQTLDVPINTSSNNNAPLTDGKWHHIALVVSESEKKAHFFYDYCYMTSIDLPDGLSYGSEDLYIGSTPQTAGPFGGSIAHARLSDCALASHEFLQLTDIDGEPNDVVLHCDFETTADFAVNDFAPLNRAHGSVLQTVRDQVRPRTTAVDDAAPKVIYGSLISENGIANTRKFLCEKKGDKRCYGQFLPPNSDDFSSKSFTVECFYKTTQSQQYTPLVRRQGGSNIQFNLGFSEAGKLNGSVNEYDVSTGKDTNRRVDDTALSNDDKWHHAALVVNAQWKKVILYRDYKPIGTVSYNGTLVPTTKAIVVGGSDYADPVFDGSIDDLRITMRALTPGEFLTESHFDATQTTLAWVSFEDTVNSASGALLNGVAAKGTDAGTEPSFVAHGRNAKILDGENNVLKLGNVKALAFDKSVVKYEDNLLLPLFKDQTIEFMIKAGPQSASAGVIRSNVYRENANLPTWGLSFANTGDATVLHLRCATQAYNGTVTESAINEDMAGVVVGDDRWHHIAMTIHPYNDPGRKTTISVYKDYSAEPVWTKTVDGGWPFYGSGNGGIWLGATSSATSFFKGQLDEVRISQGLLTVNEFLRSGKNGLAILFR